MTPEQRYWFDLTGYLHIKNALSPEELSAAQEAAKRYVDSDPNNLPDGFAIEEKRHTHGFAFDKTLEKLALHPTTWPIVKEITRNRPRLSSGTLQVNIPGQIDKAVRLHCARDDYGWDAIRYEVRDSKIFCDHIVVFPYLTDVHPGDGGLLVIPGSHKSMFDRPPEMFNNGLIEDINNLPEGVINVTPKAGDIVIINELVTHGVLPWTPKDRNRMILVLRYHPQYKGGDFPGAIKERLSPETQELIAKGGYKDHKSIVDQDVVTLTI
ncbi:MAG: hypothetical protein HOH77_22620 [Candidatus Latescibacteria bacterium]|jgi:hypothetical protein|nr:hypothetical protein [Candidatus Latescibacterota bacterium]